MAGKLYGLGIGPGDSELLTLKAVQVLQEVDLICTPVAKPGKKSVALEIVREQVNCEGRVEKLLFPMTYNQEELKGAWEEAVEVIVSYLREGKNLAFITLGDSLLYSTYIYVLNRMKKEYPDLEVETIPGISAISATAARMNIPLARGREKLVILPGIPEWDELEPLLMEGMNLVILKVNRDFDKLVKYLERAGLKDSSVFISRCGQEEEFITSDLDSLKGKEIDYLSLVISKN